MSSEELFGWAGVVFIVSAASALPMMSRRMPWLPRTGRAFAAAGVLFIVAGLAIRWHWYAGTMGITWYQAFPVSTFYESAVFFSGILAAVGLGLRGPQAVWAFLFWGAAGAALLALNLSAVPAEPVLFMPSLKSGWLMAHVSLSFVAYALYAAAALLSIAILVNPSAVDKAETVRAFIRTATLIFTVGGLIFGAVWAHESWGRFWSWDPKETWAFITWSAYCLLLHFDLQGKLSPRTLAGWVVVNFGIVLFTYFGVSLLFAGLHSYINVSVLS